MKIDKTTFLKILSYIILIGLYLYCFFYDIYLSNIKFPLLISIYFLLFMGYRFLSIYIRKGF